MTYKPANTIATKDTDYKVTVGMTIVQVLGADDKYILEFINRRRHQLLVSSAAYYELDDPYVSDDQWQQWANELRDVQSRRPDLAFDSGLSHSSHFKDWDGSTGAHLPYRRYLGHAEQLLTYIDHLGYARDI